MRRYLILCLIISSCLAVLLTSCAVKTVKGFEQKSVVAKNYPVTYFSDPKIDYVYKAHITVYGNELGGIFIVKKINDSLYRVALATDFGNKLFDFEIANNNFKVNYIVDALDKKIVVNTLKRDFLLLLKKSHEVESQYESENNTVYKSRDGYRYNYLFADKVTGRLQKLVNATKYKEKIIITYTAESDILAKNIIIEHKNIQLTINLNYLQ